MKQGIPTAYQPVIVNMPLPFIRAIPGMWPANFIGANPGQAGAYMPRDISMIECLAVYRPL